MLVQAAAEAMIEGSCVSQDVAATIVAETDADVTDAASTCGDVARVTVD